jgi:DNA polymerase family A
MASEPAADPNTGRSQSFRVGKIDFSQIECRLLNAVAGQWDIVEKFRSGVDLYSELASEFYGFPVDKSRPAERGTGKQLELSCGYGAGGPTIVRTARAGAYGPPVYLTDEQGIAARDLYRRTHGNVVQLWTWGEAVLHYLMNGAEIRWPLSPDGASLLVKDHRLFHPCGLWLDYSSLEYHQPEFDPALAEVNPDIDKPYMRYQVRDGWRKMYGGRFIENVIQWLASIPIRHRMVQINRTFGWRIPLTVHDDVFMLVPNSKQGILDFEHAKAIMSAPLDWLPECPIAVEGDLMDALDK